MTLAAAAFLAGCDPPPPATPAGAAAAPPPPAVLATFRTLGPEAGIAFERYDHIRGKRTIFESNGGGAALFDFDRDGRLDAFFTNGCRLPLSLGDRDTRGAVFRNLGALRFAEATDGSGLIQHGFAQGCAVGDVDADGFDDLYVAACGPDGYWRNNGDGTFTEAAASAGLAAPQWGTSAAFADLDLDGDLDLYVTHYIEDSDESPKLCPNPHSPDGYEQCAPAMFRGQDDLVFLSDGAGRFADATAGLGLAGLAGRGLGVVVANLGGDPRPEIFVANDGEANFLLVPTGDPADPASLRYEEQAATRGAALNETGKPQANMGVAAGDYDADGDADLYVTHFYGDTDTLYANGGGPDFRDATRPTRLGDMSLDRLGWGAVFFDPDNDGWLDLVVANGHVEDRTAMPSREPYRMRPQLLRNRRDGTFADASDDAGDYFRREWLGRGVAVGDLDGDGRVDAAVSHQLAPSVLLRNETPAERRALTLHLAGTASNRNGYGARVEVVGSDPPVVRELVGGASFLSASAPELHLGLGPADRATVRVRWPSGRVDTLENLPGGTWSVVEGRGARRLGGMPSIAKSP